MTGTDRARPRRFTISFWKQQNTLSSKQVGSWLPRADVEDAEAVMDAHPSPPLPSGNLSNPILGISETSPHPPHPHLHLGAHGWRPVWARRAAPGPPGW